MVLRSKPISDDFLAMTSEERVAALREGRVTDRNKLPEAARRRSEEMLKQVQANVAALESLHAVES